LSRLHSPKGQFWALQGYFNGRSSKLGVDHLVGPVAPIVDYGAPGLLSINNAKYRQWLTPTGSNGQVSPARE
jgi:hypothetical protein